MDGGLELDQHWVNVLCLLGLLTGYIVFRTLPDVKILKRFEPKEDLATVHIKTGSTTSKYIVSTDHRSYLITLITKAIDTTSISYKKKTLIVEALT